MYHSNQYQGTTQLSKTCKQDVVLHIVALLFREFFAVPCFEFSIIEAVWRASESPTSTSL